MLVCAYPIKGLKEHVEKNGGKFVFTFNDQKHELVEGKDFLFDLFKVQAKKQ